jgi:hypothetical protein
MKLIAFSLFGQDPKYLIGAVRNADMARDFYPDYICRFYCASDVDPHIQNELRARPNVQLISLAPDAGRLGAFWRFLAINDADADIILIRDVDSRFSLRETAAVEAWLASGLPFHVMHDHPLHGNPIIASMFGCRGQSLPELLPLIQQFNPTPGYGPDEDFLAQVVHPLMQGKVLTHAEFFNAPPTTPCAPFPTKRVGLEFVGQVFDQNDVPSQYYESVLADHLAAKVP